MARTILKIYYENDTICDVAVTGSVFGQLLDNNNTWLWNDLVIFVRVVRTFNSLTCNNIHEKITRF